MTFTADELTYLSSQRIGRLATLRDDGGLQNNPVGFTVDDAGRVIIRGHDLATTHKFRNLRRHAQAAFVVDDVVSVQPWTIRCVEIRGTAETLTGPEAAEYGTGAVIRITPERVISFGALAEAA